MANIKRNFDRSHYNIWCFCFLIITLLHEYNLTYRTCHTWECWISQPNSRIFRFTLSYHSPCSLIREKCLHQIDDNSLYYVSGKTFNSSCSSYPECKESLECKEDVCQCRETDYWDGSYCAISRYLIMFTVLSCKVRMYKNIVSLLW